MIRLDDGRIKIIGSAPILNRRQSYTNNKEYYADRMKQYFNGFDLYRYFDMVDTDNGIVDFTDENISHKFFINAQFHNIPEFKIVDSINIQGSYAHYNARRAAKTFKLNPHSTTRPNAGQRRPTAIALKSDGQRVYRGYFLPQTSTLIMGNLYYDTRVSLEYLHGFLQKLIETGVLQSRPCDDESASGEQTGFKEIFEVHNGQKVAVQIKHPRTLCTIGCDPEFEFVRNKIVIAPPPDFHGRVGENEEIGIDGASYQLELRPRADVDEKQVVKKLAELMSKLKWNISTVGDRYPVGGHIHVGVGGSWSTPHSDLVFLLDYFVGKETLPLSGAARQGYAVAGSVRAQNWGFEYRTPPAAIFDNPEFARLALKAVKNVTECFINGQEIIIGNEWSPSWEDYFNYCYFTPAEFMAWKGYINDYKAFKSAPKKYEVDTVMNWTDRATAIANTQVNTVAVVEPEPVSEVVADVQQACEEIVDRMAERIRRRQRVPIEPPEPAVICNDDWNALAQEIFVRELSPLLSGAEIRLFGLAASRGNVTYNYEVEGYDNISGQWTGYGVPYVIRMGPTTPEELNRHVEGIRAAILSPLPVVEPVAVEPEPAEARPATVITYGATCPHNATCYAADTPVCIECDGRPYGEDEAFCEDCPRRGNCPLDVSYCSHIGQ